MKFIVGVSPYLCETSIEAQPFRNEGKAVCLEDARAASCS